MPDAGTPVSLVAGLGNPGPGHARTRHNAGFWFADALALRFGGRFSPARRHDCESASVTVDGVPLRLVKPMAYMNRSGLAVRGIMDFYKLAPECVLVAHDDLDLAPGTARLKRGGGHGGHNGLRDVTAHIGADYLRLRIGIGHPRDAGGGDPVDWVLQVPSAGDAVRIGEAIDAAVESFPRLFEERGVDRVMETLNRRDTGD